MKSHKIFMVRLFVFTNNLTNLNSRIHLKQQSPRKKSCNRKKLIIKIIYSELLLQMKFPFLITNFTLSHSSKFFPSLPAGGKEKFSSLSQRKTCKVKTVYYLTCTNLKIKQRNVVLKQYILSMFTPSINKRDGVCKKY